jgi:hypothetical protein
VKPAGKLNVKDQLATPFTLASAAAQTFTVSPDLGVALSTVTVTFWANAGAAKNAPTAKRPNSFFTILHSL